MIQRIPLCMCSGQQGQPGKRKMFCQWTITNIRLADQAMKMFSKPDFISLSPLRFQIMKSWIFSLLKDYFEQNHKALCRSGWIKVQIKMQNSLSSFLPESHLWVQIKQRITLETAKDKLKPQVILGNGFSYHILLYGVCCCKHWCIKCQFWDIWEVKTESNIS